MSRKLLIIYPHWHPANLAGVHRPRLTGNYLIKLGWKVRVLTVEPECFEETPDPDFHKTFSPDFEVTRVRARKVRKPRIIGDIGLRGYRNLKRKALEILRDEKIDFIWIPIPSFYTALLGPALWKKSGVPYGIDYIDPWVRDLTNQRNPRAIVSQWIARTLEPRAVKHAALITGVSKKYYEPVLERNKLLQRKPTVIHTDFPYGFDPNDHKIQLKDMECPWGRKSSDNQIWLYTGAFLPNSHLFIDSLFQSIAELQSEQKISSPKFDSHQPLSAIASAKAEPASARHSLAKAGTSNQQPATSTQHPSPSTQHPITSNQQPATSNQQQLSTRTPLPATSYQLRAYFLGTGPYPAKPISAYAADHNISSHVTEIRSRFPYLQTLNFQSAADVVMIIGSTEKHYTASKTYQSLLSKRPIFAILHAESQAVQVLEECNADQYTVRYREEMLRKELKEDIKKVLSELVEKQEWEPDLSALEKYSAKESARRLAEAIERVLSRDG